MKTFPKMKSTFFLVSTAWLLFAVGLTVASPDDISPRRGDTARPGKKSTQVGFSSIIVNGRTLTGPNSSAQTRDGHLLIPVAGLARALGDSVQVDPSGKTITVNRNAGSSSSYDSRLGQVKENNVVVLSISNPGLIILSPFVEEAMLPSEIVSALFDASLRFDRQKNAVIVTRGIVGVVTQQKKKQGIGELYFVEYEYNLNRYSSTNSQGLTLSAIGRLADGRFSLVSNSSGNSLGQMSPKNFNFSLERPNGQHFVAGDFGTGAALQLLTSNIRGGLVSIPVGNFTIAAFAGRSNSGTVGRDGAADFAPLTRNRNLFDTNVFGVSATTKPFDSGILRPLSISAGALRFAGSSRQGSVVSTSLNFGGQRTQLQADFGLGTFNGFSTDNRVARGIGMAIDLAASYQATSNLSFQGRFAHIDSNFLAPQTGVREPVNLKAGGVSWSPVKWLTTSVNASTTRRPNDTGRAESFMSTSIVLSPGGAKPQFYVSHTQSSSRNYRKGEFTLINFSKSFQRFRVFANATRVKNIGPASVTTQLGANFLINERNTLEVNQGFSRNKAFNGLAEWRTDGLFKHRLNLSAGLGYTYSQNAKLDTYQRFSASLNLPRASSLQVSYLQTNAGPTLLVRLRGTLFRRCDAGAYLNSHQSDVNDFSSASGRVYQDINGDGKYTGGVDKPQSGIKVRVDGNRYVETDVNGLWAFEAISSGEHKVYVDLLSVRADLTLVDGGARELNLEAGKNSIFDFRLVRTGRVTGRVFLDKNENGVFDQGETPLADIRVVTASGRDTLTDNDGNFTIGDLPPGEHVFLLDEKTLPEKTTSGSKSIAVQSFAGRESTDINLTVIPTPAEIKRFAKRQN